MMVRKPAVAGMFYSAEKEKLQKQIKNFLSNTRSLVQNKEKLRILLVPHAGYSYSGQVAAWGFGQLKNGSYQRVVLLGSSHQAYFSGAVVDENDFWQTPLGKVKVQKDWLSLPLSALPHQNEHGLEVEVPFLQTVLGQFKIVPLLLGRVEKDFCEKLAKTLAKKIDPQTLVVVSSDLSHYPSAKIAQKVDQKTIEAIISGEVEEFRTTMAHQLAKGYPGLSTGACAQKAIEVGMRLSQKLKLGQGKLFQYAHSGEVSGERQRVVGYASLGFIDIIRRL